MGNIYKILICKQIYDQSEFGRNTLVKTGESDVCCDVEDIPIYYHVALVEYLRDGEEYVGVKLSCDHGNGNYVVDLAPDEEYEFEHNGIWIDDEGCPEDYSIRYLLRVQPYMEDR